MEKIMAVLTGNRKYSERLSAYVNGRNSIRLTAVPFDSTEALEDFARRHSIGLLLAEEGVLPEGGAAGGLEQYIDRDRIIRLVPDMSKAAADSSREPYGRRIGMFMPADKILQEIIEMFPENELLKAAARAGRGVRLIGIYSPFYCPDRLIFALALSRVISRKKKTLYLNFEEFPGFGTMTGEDYSGMSDAVYYMKQGQLDARKLYSVTGRICGIDYIPPVSIAEDRCMLHGPDYTELINCIFMNSDYEVIVADIGRFADEGSELMSMCDTVYMPLSADELCRIRVGEFEEYLMKSGRERLQEKLRRIYVPEYDRSQDPFAYLDTALLGPVGDFVRALGEV